MSSGMWEVACLFLQQFALPDKPLLQGLLHCLAGHDLLDFDLH